MASQESNLTPTCGNCFYAVEIQDDLECRRYAPQVFGYGQEGDTVTAWPRVAPEDSCGEFERTPD